MASNRGPRSVSGRERERHFQDQASAEIRRCLYIEGRNTSFQGVFAEKGARFRCKWGPRRPSPPSPPTPDPSPRPQPWGRGGFSENPGGGGGSSRRGGGEGQGCVRGIWGGGGGGQGRRGPIYRENEPLFRRKHVLVAEYDPPSRAPYVRE